MPAKGVLLFSGSSFIGSSVIGQATWDGGRSSLVCNATQYGLSVQFQFQGPSGNWMAVCSSLVADQIFSFDAPPGQYRMVGAGSSINLFASLTSIPYMG